MQITAALAAELGRRLGRMGAPLWLVWLGVAAIVLVAALTLAALLLPGPEPVLVAPFRW